ncbi:hypothetical protein LASUN_22880 [Lentilactobacillus sunkii]|jgi:PHD/YefM family antitoxin component YafN of YafNO toxin-antitoxin module|uniref:Antitoxin n=1 Tax=Lentilactobacillus sunkii TaxID=481719 RepID=A0A1E7X9J1_9LACO|nr:type II toxin-antitoxin system Phd/YefM family antitoxin [Lentilactobacillus sunkii]OFA09806.1 hypothetical protein LASUN_22880 [Lentilactobacillus sunkii]
MTVLNTPLMSVTELQKSPTKAFEKAKWNETGVFVLKRNEMLGVILSKKDYDKIMYELEELRCKVFDAGIEHKMNNNIPEHYTDYEMLGPTNDSMILD